MSMQELTYQVSFNTPAFLGNAEQQAQWRTPPFKALLRQWWRVAYAANNNFQVDVAAMRVAEGRLFGHAWLENDRDAHGEKVAARKSLVRLRLGQWNPGKLRKSDWVALDRVTHPEVNAQVPADLYLGYGPVTLPRGERNPTLKANAAIQTGENTTFSLACPREYAKLIEHALVHMNRFGTVGGRSRNGWGSFTLQPENVTSEPTNTIALREWKECLGLDWPHAIGRDSRGGLVWQTPPHADWKTLMKELAVIKIALRRQFIFPRAQPDGQVHDRHWLSYPVTTHRVNDWNRNNARLPNSLRFKVRPTTDGKLIGVIFHMPCLPPPAFSPNHAAIELVWQKVHAFLDGHAALTRSRG